MFAFLHFCCPLYLCPVRSKGFKDARMALQRLPSRRGRVRRSAKTIPNWPLKSANRRPSALRGSTPDGLPTSTGGRSWWSQQEIEGSASRCSAATLLFCFFSTFLKNHSASLLQILTAGRDATNMEEFADALIKIETIVRRYTQN